MLKQGSVYNIRHGEITRPDNYVVITMRHYPRGLSKTASDEYIAALAPDKDLLKDWLEAVKSSGHDGAFAATDYEERFHMNTLAFAYLKRFALMAQKQDLYFICQCAVGEMCHREILMHVAHSLFHVPVDKIYHSYTRFMERVPELLEQARFDPSLDARPFTS